MPRRVDLPGDENLCIVAADNAKADEYHIVEEKSGHIFGIIRFQSGVIPEVGVNGVTIESLLAVCADRLNGFQKGEYANFYNQQAITHIKAAHECLNARTRDRKNRGVEGTYQQ